MTTFTGTQVKTDVQAILNDTTEWTDAEILAFLNLAVQQVSVDAPASRYSSPVSFGGNMGIAALATAVNMDIRWKNAVVHYTAFLCFNQSDRSTSNAAFAAEQYRLYKEAL